MYKVFVGGISPEGEHLLTTYLNVFMPDAEIEPLKAVGIKGKMKNHAKRQDVALVIIDESLYQACVGVADDVLSLPKVHKYINDDGLNQFLITKFGRLDGVDINESSVIPPDMLMAQSDTEEDPYIPKNSDIFTTPDAPTPLPEQVEVRKTGITHIIKEDDDNLVVRDDEITAEEKDNNLILELKDKLAKSELMVHNLTLQLEDKASDSADDISAFLERIRELEAEVESLKKQSANTEEDNYINLGKIARAEQIISEFADMKAEIKRVNEDKSELEHDKSVLNEKISSLSSQIDELQNKVVDLDNINAELSEKKAKVEELILSIDEKADELTAKDTEIEQLNAEIRVLQEEVDSDKQKISELEGLQQELSAKQLELDNLQIDFDNKNQEIGTLIQEIEGLKLELNEKVDSIMSLEDELSSVKSEKEQLDSSVSELNETIESLKVKLEGFDEIIKTKDTSIENLEEELALKTIEVEDLTSKLSDKSNELEKLNEKLASNNGEIEGYNRSLEQQAEELSQVQKDLESITAQVADKDLELAKLQDELSEKDSELSKLRENSEEQGSTVLDLEKKLSDSNEEINTLEAKVLEDTEEITKLQSEISSVKSELAERDSKINSLESDLQVKEDDLAKYRSIEESLKSQIETLTSDNNALAVTTEELEKLRLEVIDQKDEINGLNSTIVSLNSQIESKNREIARLVEVSDLAHDNSEVQSQAVDRILAEKQELENKLEEYESIRVDLDSKVKTLEEKIKELEDTNSGQTLSINSLSEEKNKLENQITQLQTDLQTSKEGNDKTSKIESDLLEERRKSARLESELEVLKKTSDSGKTSELRIEIARLKKELESVKNSNDEKSNEELERVTADLEQERKLRAALELDIVDKDELINELSESVFAQMQNSAMPKVTYDIELPKLVNVGSNFYCVASGSEESSVTLYQTLRKACAENSNKRILIVDLVTDSCIDREFGIQKIVSPYQWLIGSDTFKNYIANTRFNNVKVISTALAYLNDLSLLTVDWQKKVNDLGAFSADVVILSVGCLNNTVSKVLFNMFSKSMCSYIITKATPVNLRTVILNLTGFRSVSPNVSVECVGFDDKASKGMYERLVAKYKAHILQASDVLKL